MKSILDDRRFFHSNACIALQLSHPCAHCRCCYNLPPGHYVCDNGCWVNQHYWHLEARKLSWNETRERFRFLLTGEGINATIPERLLYLQTAVELGFPQYLPLINELADQYHIERLGT